jgi:DNA-binding transcriptional LysR family regulator
MESIQPHFESIAAGISAISALRDKPSGHVRVVCRDDAVELVFRPKLSAFLQDFPDVTVEIIVDNGFTNIVELQFDAGVRLGEAVARDIVAVRIGPDVSYSVVASPNYLERHGPPSIPQDLTGHNCVNLRLPTSGGLYAWEFERDGREFSMRVEGQLTLSNIAPAIDAALDGIGLAYVPTDLVQPYVDNGRLRRVLSEWCPTFRGYHLYYPSRRNPSRAFSAFVDAFRCKQRK